MLLRSSRQHVVDMCERGLLPYIKVGSRRRLRRADVEAILRPELTRDQLKALWLHRAVAVDSSKIPMRSSPRRPSTWNGCAGSTRTG